MSICNTKRYLFEDEGGGQFDFLESMRRSKIEILFSKREPTYFNSFYLFYIIKLP